ncbi:MAG: hypothetical protein HQM10_21710 [Candidatus Riflebacteria bacterium]|nr:hypothetical protein [Candidatus Riflebacteria bacterium]
MSYEKMMKSGHKSGIALFFILATIMFVSIVVLSMVYFMRGEVFLSENYVDGVSALLLAEAGAEEAFFTMKKSMNDPKNPFYSMVTKNEGGYVDVDLSHLEGKDKKIAPIVEGGKVKARIYWSNDASASKALTNAGLPPDIAREGLVTVVAKGTVHGTHKQIEVKKALKAVQVQSEFIGNSVGMIAPEHGLYLNTAHVDSFKINPTDFWDPWGFTVKGGKVYMRDGARIDIPKWLMLFAMRNEFEHPFLDQGIGWNGYNGGGNFAETDSIEYSKDPVTRSYYKWMGLLRWPWWQKIINENYNSNTKQVSDYESKKINLYDASVYSRLANRVVDPEKNPTHGKYFTDVNFREAFGRNEVSFKNVVPLFGWGDWRKVPNKYNRFLGNPNRSHDTSHAVELNGLTFIKGDVYLEGWVKGKGLLVVQGNIYVGGDILTLPDDSGQQSSVGIIALRDPRFDHAIEKPLTGRILYKPHHDSDWSRLGITHPFRNLSPRLEGCFYAQGGLELDTDTSMKKLINMEIVGNLATDYFDRRRMPNDVKIKHFNWQEVLASSRYDYTVDRETRWSSKYEVSLKREIISWREVVPATL